MIKEIKNDEELLEFLEPYTQLIPWNCKKFEPVREYLNNRYEDKQPYWRVLWRIRNKINNDDELLKFLEKYKRKNIPWKCEPCYPAREYLEKRFNDSTSYSESYYRIVNKIFIRPVCPVCGKPVNFHCFAKGFSKSCGDSSHAILNPEVQEKTKKTCLEKYGCEFTFQTEHNKKLSKETWIKKYGCEYPMQSKEIQEKVKKTCLDRYGKEFVFQVDKFKEKYKQTCLERYGVENPTQNKEILNKIRKTTLERYGVPTMWLDKKSRNKAYKARQTPEAWEKYKQTCLEKYGHEWAMQNENIKEKHKQTCLEKYGVENIWFLPENKQKAINARQTPEAWDKYRKTCLERYGFEFYQQSEEGRKRQKEMVSSKEVQEKINESKRKNKSFNSSKPENESYKILKEKFEDIIQSYRCERYPFNCDFYIPSLDLFIECNYHWTHCGHPYNENNIDDIEIVNKMENKNTQFYKNAIKTWTIRDVNKRNTAKENNLNYLEFWNIEELKEWLAKFE